MLIFPEIGSINERPLVEEPSPQPNESTDSFERRLELYSTFAGISVRVALLPRAQARELARRHAKIWADEEARDAAQPKPSPRLSEQCQAELEAWNRDMVEAAGRGVPGVQVGRWDLGKIEGKPLAEHLDACGLLPDVARVCLQGQTPTAQQLESFAPSRAPTS